MSSLPLPFDPGPGTRESRIDARDRDGRVRAVDPRYNVALEASAGTGKTRVLVDRYVNLLRLGVDPSNVLAITFTRKAAAEMRERIVTTLRAAAERGEIPAPRWRELRDRLGDIAISTIDAFCLSLLREFPLEADLDPGFAMADETEVPRLIDEALDRTLRTCRQVAREDEHVALVFAQLGERRSRAGLATLLHRRVVAPRVLADYLARGPRDLTVATAVGRAAVGLRDVFEGMRGGFDRFVATGPPEPEFLVLVRGLSALPDVTPAALQAIFARTREYFLTQDGQPRARLAHAKAKFTTPAHWSAHRDLVVGHAPAVRESFTRYKRDLNVLVSRGIARMYAIAESEYRRTLDAHAALDFSDVLLRTLELLRRMEEFSQSRYRLESRYHHVLVDEFQDTSRAQWELVSLLVESWGEGVGLAHSGPLAPSIFIVGDRKQSIYAFRDADVSVVQEASRYIEALRPDGDVRRSISRSFRSVPSLLSFVNDVCHDMTKAVTRRDAFLYEEQDRFPLDTPSAASEALGVVLEDTPEACAALAADEIVRLISSGATVRDRETGVPRPVRPADVAILFRTRESHRVFEDALQRRQVASYVYKGLGFFDADEIKDVLALLWYLADPLSNLRAAAFMRSRFVRLSDDGLRRLAPWLSDALRSARFTGSAASLSEVDAAALTTARDRTLTWRGLVDRLPPAELLDRILVESSYAVEMRGPRYAQARENLKKLRSLVRRIQNRGYATLGRIASHLDRLAMGDEANASLDALDAVSLMTVHASKGLEFPVVFLANLTRGTGARREAIRVTADPDGDSPSVAVGDYESDTDEDTEREREETKRLLYVGLTRARDRLYLCSVLRDGRLQPARGSLAEVLPASLVTLMSDRNDSLEWCASSGSVHRLRLVRRDDIARQTPESPAPASPHGSPPDRPMDLDPLAATPSRVTVAALAGMQADGLPAEGADSDRLLGVIVHRLLERLGPAAPADLVRSTVPQLVTAPEVAEDEGHRTLHELIEVVPRAYAAIANRPDIGELLAGGRVLHEVPFTMLGEGQWIRGTIDCLVQRDDGSVTILEFKTGRPRPEHAIQLKLYARAAELLFPGAMIHARLLYPLEHPQPT